MDIGAYEASVTIYVSTDVDESDTDHGPADLSLREALELAADAPGFDVIRFDPALAGATITLILGQLEINSSVDILAPDVTVDAANASRVFRVSGQANALLEGLTITRGRGGFSSMGGLG